MNSQEPEKQPKLNRLGVEIVVVTALFFGLLVGVQALQGSASPPKYDPLAILFGPVRFLQSLQSK